MSSVELERNTDAELRELAHSHGIEAAARLDRRTLLERLRERLNSEQSHRAHGEPPAGASLLERARRFVHRTLERTMGRARSSQGPGSPSPETAAEPGRRPQPHAATPAAPSSGPLGQARPPVSAPTPPEEPPAAAAPTPAVATTTTAVVDSGARAAGEPVEPPPRPEQHEQHPPHPPQHAPMEPMGMLDLEELPEGYGVDTVCLLARDPWSLFCYWEVTGGRIEAGRHALGEHPADLILRTTFTAPHGAAARPEHSVDTPLPGYIGRMYLDATAGLRASVRIGLRGPSGRFVPVLWSPSVAVPPDRPGPDGPVEWMTVAPPPLQRSRLPERLTIVVPLGHGPAPVQPLPRQETVVFADGSSRLAERRAVPPSSEAAAPSSWVATSPGRWRPGV